MELVTLLCTAVVALGIGDNSERAEFACQNMQNVVRSAEKHGVDPALLVSLIHHESRWFPKSVSRSSACGLTQVIPKWTGGRSTGGSKYSCKDLFQPKVSIDVGAQILSFWIKDYARGRWTVGLCGYNAGYRCKGKSPNSSGLSYAKRVRRTARALRRYMKKHSQVPSKVDK